MKRWLCAILAALVALPVTVFPAKAAPSLTPGAVTIYTGETFIIASDSAGYYYSDSPANIVSVKQDGMNFEVSGQSVGVSTLSVGDGAATSTSVISVLPNNNFSVTLSTGGAALPINNDNVTITRSSAERIITLNVDSLSSSYASSAVTFNITKSDGIQTDSDSGPRDMTSSKAVNITVPQGVTGYAAVSMSYVDMKGITVFSRTIYISIEPPIPYTSIEFAASNYTTIATGDSATLVLDKLPSSGNEEIVFSSSNDSILSVEPLTGKVTAVSPGIAVITAVTESGKLASISLTSIEAVVPTAMWINKSVDWIGVNNQLQLSVSFSPSNASNSVKWSIINAYSPKYYITENGLLITTSLAQDGDSIVVMCESTITKLTDVLFVTVRDGVAASELSIADPPVSVIAVGAKLQLTAVSSPTDARLIWASSNTAVMTVSGTGLVSAISPGSAEITVSSGALSSSVELRAQSGGVAYRRVISMGPLTVRSLPSTSATIVGTLQPGSIVEFLGQTGHFSSIRFDGSTRYVSSQYLGTLGTMYVAASRLKVRLAPNTNATELGEFVFAQKVSIIGRENSGWMQVAYNGTVGYCASGYLNAKPFTAYPTAATALAVRSAPWVGSEIKDRVSNSVLLTIEAQSGLYYYVSYSGGKSGYVARAHVRVVPVR